MEPFRQPSTHELSSQNGEVKLIRDRVLVLLDEYQPDGLIWQPEWRQEDGSGYRRQVIGTVVKVGLEPRTEKGGALIPHEIQEGDRVLVSPYQGVEMKWDGKPALMLRETEVLAVLEGK